MDVRLKQTNLTYSPWAEKHRSLVVSQTAIWYNLATVRRLVVAIDWSGLAASYASSSIFRISADTQLLIGPGQG